MEGQPLVGYVQSCFPASDLYNLGFRNLFNERLSLFENKSLVSSWTDDSGTEYLRIIIMFIGQTGAGKSSTINSLVQKSILKTDDIACCTKQISFIDFDIDGEGRRFITFCDMPGIGESSKADAEYETWYLQMLDNASCVVYVLKADNRALERDYRIINSIKEQHHLYKIVFMLNQVDKEEPYKEWNSYLHCPSPAQVINIEKKKFDIQRKFHCIGSSILLASVSEKFGMSSLMEKLEETTINNCKHNIIDVDSFYLNCGVTVQLLHDMTELSYCQKQMVLRKLDQLRAPSGLENEWIYVKNNICRRFLMSGYLDTKYLNPPESIVFLRCAPYPIRGTVGIQELIQSILLK